MGNPEGKRPLGRPQHIWEDSTKINIRQIGWWDGMDWIRFIWLRIKFLSG
jgi:hypothetical protein